MTLHIRRSCAAVALVALVASAAAPAAAQRADTVVRLAGKPLHAGVATLVREMTFGVVDGADEYMFGDVAEIAVAKDGSVYVYDRHVPALRKYDANGKFIKAFGRKGQGPGEYMSVSGLALLPDGRVLLWDPGNWRVDLYTPDGVALPAWSAASGASGSASIGGGRNLFVDSESRTYIKRPLFGPAVPGVSRTRQVWIRYRPDGTPIDTLPMPTFDRLPVGLQATSPGGNAFTGMDVPFAAPPKWALMPSGHVVTGIGDRYAFEFRGEPGRPVTSIRRDAQPTPVTSHERDSARSAVIERMRKTDPAWTWNGPDIPKNKPYYADLAVGEDGRIWVTLIPEVTPRLGSVSGPGFSGAGPAGRPTSVRPPPRPGSAPKPKPALFDVFEPDGTYVGQVQVPPRVSSAVRRGDYIWALEYDEDDVQKISRFRIAWK